MKPSVSTAFLIATLWLSACASPAQQGFKYFGSWSNVMVSQGEDPHALGYTLQLWKNDGKPLGFFSEFAGPPADPPIGQFENLMLDEKTGQVSFSVKMTVGVVYSSTHKDGAPSRLLYTFKGTLQDDIVTGTLQKEDRLNGGNPSQEQVTLKRESDSSAESHWNSKTMQEWEAFYAPILQARGPRW
jgi:hypothetical protein